MKSSQLTVRGVPIRLNEVLRKKAKEEGKSLNAVLVESLMRGAGLGPEEPCFNDLDSIIGTWVEDPKFDEAMEMMNKIDPELWT